MTTQTRTIAGQTYHFVCLEGRNGYDVVEVMAPMKGPGGCAASVDVKRVASSLYPKFRYERYRQWPWQLLGKSSAESSRVLDVLNEIWDAAL